MDSTTPDAQIPPIRHTGSVQGAALSPCGRYLAVGTGIEIPEGAWHTEYEDGGVLHVFELATGGRVAGIVEPGALRGGVGWTDYPGAIQWSADSARLGLAYDTNMVGVWDVFSGAQGPAATAYVTDGGNRPPSFALAPDGRRALIDLGPVDECGVPGILVPLDGGDLSWYHADADPEPAEGEPRLMASALGAPFEETPGESQLGMERAWGWDRDGTRVHVVDFHDVYAIDIGTGRPLWIREHGVDYSWWDDVAPAAFSPDGTRVAWYTADRLHLADAATGRTTADLDREEATVLVWGRARLAALSPAGIRIIDGDGGTVRLPAVAALGRGMVSDIVPLAWSPDGERVAVITEEGAVEIWNLDGTTEPAATFAGPPEAAGLYWGDSIAVLGRRHLHFRTPEGATVGEIDLHAEPAGGRGA